MANKPGPVELYARIDPIRYARNAVHVAIGNGTLSRPAGCSRADGTCKGRIEAHHESYAPERWLDVTWICASHHRRLHPHR